MNYYSYMLQVNMIQAFFVLFILLIIIGVISSIFGMRKSKRYRKEIVDMYVASKTKKLALEEGLDLIEEFESFKKWLKRRRLEYSGVELNDVIESELMEKVQGPKPKEKKK